MKTLEQLKQQLLNGLNSADYEKYVDLIVENINHVVDDNDAYELQWLENDCDVIAEYLSRECYNDALSLINYIKSVDYDECEDFVEYNGLATKSYEELRDLYVEKLFSDYYAEVLAELLEEIAEELVEMN